MSKKKYYLFRIKEVELNKNIVDILVDLNGNVKFCDLDGCSYKGSLSPFISILMKRFFINYRREQMVLNPNLDRISMLLSFFFIVSSFFRTAAPAASEAD